MSQVKVDGLKRVAGWLMGQDVVLRVAPLSGVNGAERRQGPLISRLNEVLVAQVVEQRTINPKAPGSNESQAFLLLSSEKLSLLRGE